MTALATDSRTSPFEIDFNPQFERAYDLMEKTQCHVFITGCAGSGKSTLLNFFKAQTAKRMAVLAPTGVAALNVGGQTLHSFFGFKPDVTPKTACKRIRSGKGDIYRKLDTILIDEISMVRADLLDCVDAFLRINGPTAGAPFGGLQMIFIGDLYQLPPVVTSAEKMLFRTLYRSPYFFSATSFQQLDFEFVELEKVYRQKDDCFIGLLNTIRNRTVTTEEIELLNSRHDPGFEPKPEDFYIHLTSTNELADRYNEEQLAKLKGKTWKAVGLIEGNFGREYIPTARELKLKPGAQIMLLNNDSAGRWVNGTMGRVTRFGKDPAGEPVIRARLENGRPVEIAPFTWEIYRFLVKEDQLISETVGTFTQFPARLAFAVTIHKSQGKTFDRVIIDVGRGTFAPGQLYVALSRCTSLEGIVLRSSLRKNQILLDWEVVRFMTRSQYKHAAQKLSPADKIHILDTAIQKGHLLEMTYLKSSDVKTKRTVQPLSMGEMEYAGRPFFGLEAWCLLRREKRVFNVDRILDIKIREEHRQQEKE